MAQSCELLKCILVVLGKQFVATTSPTRIPGFCKHLMAARIHLALQDQHRHELHAQMKAVLANAVAGKFEAGTSIAARIHSSLTMCTMSDAFAIAPTKTVRSASNLIANLSVHVVGLTWGAARAQSF